MNGNLRTGPAGVLLASVLALSIPFTELRALDFTPTFIETEVEAGVKNREVVLKDGPARVVYCPPADWRPEAGGKWLRFRPLDASMADLTIDADKAPAGRVADATEIQRCRERLKAAVPRESTDVVLEDDEENPGSVENLPTFGLTVAYSSGGIRYRKRVVFVFTPESELRFTLVARAADFDRLYPHVRESLFSWRWER